MKTSVNPCQSQPLKTSALWHCALTLPINHVTLNEILWPCLGRYSQFVLGYVGQASTKGFCSRTCRFPRTCRPSPKLAASRELVVHYRNLPLPENLSSITETCRFPRTCRPSPKLGQFKSFLSAFLSKVFIWTNRIGSNFIFSWNVYFPYAVVWLFHVSPCSV